MISGVPLHYDQDLSLPPSRPEGGSAVRSAPTLANISPTSLSLSPSLVRSFIHSLGHLNGRGGAAPRKIGERSLVWAGRPAKRLFLDCVIILWLWCKFTQPRKGNFARFCRPASISARLRVPSIASHPPTEAFMVKERSAAVGGRKL